MSPPAPFWSVLGLGLAGPDAIAHGFADRDQQLSSPDHNIAILEQPLQNLFAHGVYILSPAWVIGRAAAGISPTVEILRQSAEIAPGAPQWIYQYLFRGAGFSLSGLAEAGLFPDGSPTRCLSYTDHRPGAS